MILTTWGPDLLIGAMVQCSLSDKKVVLEASSILASTIVSRNLREQVQSIGRLCGDGGLARKVYC